MTRAEYMEFVEERLTFRESGVGSPDPSAILYDKPEVVRALAHAHREYCKRVAEILEIDRDFPPLAEELMPN